MSGHRPWSEVKGERQARLEREAQQRELEAEAASAPERLRGALGLPPSFQIDYTAAGGVRASYVPPAEGLVDECDGCDCRSCVMSGPHERHEGHPPGDDLVP